MSKFKQIQRKLTLLRDRIEKDGGRITGESEEDLRSLVRETLIGANDELQNIHDKLQKLTENAAAPTNDNAPALTEEQKTRLSLTEKAGLFSSAVH